MTDWYEERHRLQSGMVFKDRDDDIVMLDKRVEGDGTNWYVSIWWNGSWAYDDYIIHPSDLVEEMPDYWDSKEY